MHLPKSRVSDLLYPSESGEDQKPCTREDVQIWSEQQMMMTLTLRYSVMVFMIDRLPVCEERGVYRNP